MSGLSMAPRFGLSSGPNELDGRERMLILAALGNQRQYSLRLAERNRNEEARGQNLVNALEIQVLIDKLKKAWKGEADDA